MNPPISWYGGKTTHARWIIDVMSRYRFDSYIEPFGGSGAVLFAKKPSKNEVYNDIHGDVVNIYEVIRNPKTFGKFKRFVTLTPFSRLAFERSVKALETCTDRVERAGHFFVRARQCFGGVTCGKPCWSNSIIHKSQRVNAYINTVDRLDEVHDRLRTVQIEHMDALDCIRHYAFSDDDGCSLVYADPPYVFATRCKKRKYHHEFETIQHEQLVDTLLKTPGHKVLSGYETELYQPLLDAGWEIFRKYTYTRMTNGNDKKRIECLYCSPFRQNKEPTK